MIGLHKDYVKKLYDEFLYKHKGKKFDTYAFIFPIDKSLTFWFNLFKVRVIWNMHPFMEEAQFLWEDDSVWYEENGYLEMTCLRGGGSFIKKFRFRKGEYLALFLKDQDGGGVMNETFFHANFEKVSDLNA